MKHSEFGQVGEELPCWERGCITACRDLTDSNVLLVCTLHLVTRFI